MTASSQTFDVPYPELQRVNFEEAWEAHRGRVFHWALRYGAGDRAWAEDVTHDVFLKLWRQLSQLANCDDLGGWLYTVTARMAVSRLRARNGLLTVVQKWLQPTPAADPDEALHRRRTAHAALGALDKLPDRERVVLCMVALDGLSQREVSLRLRLSESYVSKLLQRAREQLRVLGWEVES
jgi:RNA polymerase sigma-70 factor (ECF subfamily)